jgi:membrane protease YdiL (CAAX protease family)
MGLLAWVIAPLVADRLSGPGALRGALIVTLAAGLAWQFVLVMVVVAREQGTLRSSVLRDSLWLRAPRAPRTGRRRGRAWLIVPLLVIALAAEELVPGSGMPAGRPRRVLDSGVGRSLLAGAWVWFAVLVVRFVLNTVLGEELLFRGYLSPG